MRPPHPAIHLMLIILHHNSGNTTDLSSLPGANVARETIPSKKIGFVSAIFLGLGAGILFTFTSYYAYQSLVASNPALGALSFTPSTTVLVINLLSQTTRFTLSHAVSASLTNILLGHENGDCSLTALALDSAKSPLEVASLLSKRGSHRLWCLLRYDCSKKEIDSQTDVLFTLRSPWIYSHRF